MSLSAGDRLGPYEIVAPIGKGGMGEVYRALDPRVGREVAIKVSNEQFSERFEREARAIAALNHPNICQLYDVGPNYLVMELIEGVEPKGPLPLEEALPIAKQIADALEAAHEKNIVHRDLKPANIKIKADGAVKVLDFGLATVTQASTPVPDPANSPTLTMAATQAGMILGTAGYMSPEQARGKQVDKRADIWAFGVVLYEMLTGKRLFQGDDITDTLAAVLRHEPDWEQVPAKVRRLLRRCLAKDPSKRLRDIGDAWELLEEAPKATAPSPSRFSWMGWGIAAVAVLGLAILAFVHFREAPLALQPVLRFSIGPPEGAHLSGFEYGAVALSPDGRSIAFAAEKSGQRMLWVRALDSLDARPLAGTEGAAGPFWSPDSRMLGFIAQGKVKRIEVSSSAVQSIGDSGIGENAGQRGGVWGADNTILFSIGNASGVSRVPVAGGQVTPVTTLDPAQQETSHIPSALLPDGKHYLFHRRAGGDETEGFGVWVGLLGSKERKNVLKGTTRAIYAPPHNGRPGCLLYVRGATLTAQPFDAARLEFTGDPVVLADGVSVTVGRTQGDFSVSATGALAYRRGGAVQSELAWFDRAGKPAGGMPNRPIPNMLRISPDGKSLAVVSGRDIWVHEFDRGVWSRVTFSGNVQRAVWSPDGTRVAYSTPKGDIYWKSASGAGKEELAMQGDGNTASMSDWSSDGRLLMFSGSGVRNLYTLELSARGTARPTSVFQSPRGISSLGRFFPAMDGPPHWFTYMSNESGADEVYVQAMPGEQPGKWQVSNGGGTAPLWRRDGRELFYVAPDNTIVAVDVRTAPAFHLGAPHPLFKGPARLPGAGTYDYDVSADGQKFLLVTPSENAIDSPIEIVLNWQEMLKKGSAQ